MTFGWGLFNLVEGIIDHHVLEIHHVRDMPVHVPMYDWLILRVGGNRAASRGMAPDANRSSPGARGGTIASLSVIDAPESRHYRSLSLRP